MSELELEIAKAEVEVKKINAQAHLLSASKGHQSVSTFGSEVLESVQQGGLGMQASSVPRYSSAPLQAGPVVDPSSAVGTRDGNNCAVCHSVQGAGKSAGALGAFDVDQLTIESANRAIQAMYQGAMPKGQPRYSLEEIQATKSQLEAALGVMLK